MSFPRRSFRRQLPVLLGLGWLGMLGASAHAASAQATPTVSILLSLPTTIQGVTAGLTAGENGALYGAASVGGDNGAGAIYTVQPNGTGFRLLHSLDAIQGLGVNNDGKQPLDRLIAPGDGYLYGTAEYGGASKNGTVFRVSLDGKTFQTLHAFTALDSNFHNLDGANPSGSVTAPGDGYLYGTTQFGGPGDRGVVFRVKTDGTGFQTLHNFAAVGDPNYNSDGSWPSAALTVGSDGRLYGTAQFGGANGWGAAYRLQPDGTGFQLLHSFTPSEGRSFTALTQATDGRFYGVNFQGGDNLGGLIFGLNADGTGFTPLHTFSGADGSGPYGALAVGSDNLLYGTTENGGTSSWGTVFRVNLDGTGFQTLASFAGSAQSDASTPVGTLLRVGNQLYGTSEYGGPIGFGTLFTVTGITPKATPPAPSHLLWDNASGTAAVWNLSDTNPAATAFVAGPFTGWTAKQIAQGPDGKARLLWINTSGQAALWNLADTNPAATCSVYGPFPGWVATALTVGPDNAAHLLWDNTDGRVALWNTTDPNPSATCTIAGPYSGWAGVAIGIGSDNHERLLWDNTSEQVAVWNLADANPAATCLVYGPFSGWTAKRLSVGDDNAAHLLWDNVSGQVSLWNLSDANPAASALVYGPYSGWSGEDLSVGADSKGRLLWDNVSGQNSLWNLADASPAGTCVVAGPYSGWTAVSVAAAE